MQETPSEKNNKEGSKNSVHVASSPRNIQHTLFSSPLHLLFAALLGVACTFVFVPLLVLVVAGIVFAAALLKEKANRIALFFFFCLCHSFPF